MIVQNHRSSTSDLCFYSVIIRYSILIKLILLSLWYHNFSVNSNSPLKLISIEYTSKNEREFLWIHFLIQVTENEKNSSIFEWKNIKRILCSMQIHTHFINVLILKMSFSFPQRKMLWFSDYYSTSNFMRWVLFSYSFQKLILFFSHLLCSENSFGCGLSFFVDVSFFMKYQRLIYFWSVFW